VNNGEANNRSHEEPLGVICPRCECRHFHTLETRRTYDGRIMRVKKCRHCGKQLRTYEQLGT
jgi:transcriptional regulator NrdR family protein